MNETILSRLTAFRRLMSDRGISAAIIPQADPHQGEYLASHWQVRPWLSGFKGSAGDLVVTASGAALWTDSRYFLQAASELDGTTIELMKLAIPGTPSIAEYICGNLNAGDTVGLDGMLFTEEYITSLRRDLDARGINLVTDFDVIDSIWTDRPALPDDRIFVHDAAFAGQSARDKIASILADAQSKGASAVFESMLDSIAWVLNIRSNDVKYTPVATAFLFLAGDGNILFTDPAKLTDDVRNYLAAEGVATRDYKDIKEFLRSLPDRKVLVDSNHTAYELLSILGARAIDGGTSAAVRLKAVKNDIQIAGIRNAMARDGVAMVRSLMEIERRVKSGDTVDELEVAAILRKYRSQGEFYVEESFGTIAGYGPHGAIVHYEASEETNARLEPHGLLLIDSGAQYQDGTTDITRTIALGTPTEQEKHDFTLVMKGHICLAQAVFPAGTYGTQLDVLAHQYLWKHGLNYLHGTGHGVGHFLSVHEGPHSIRMNYMPYPIMPGSVTSNEPGVYLENVHGIRCENLVLCKEKMTTDFGTFLCFETLTLCPFDRSLFDIRMMTSDETAWVDNYHATVRDILMPLLATDEERAWLENATKPLNA